MVGTALIYQKDFLASTNRAKVVEDIQYRFFDLIVVGGGITGAGIALDATARGLKTLLVEKKDFASGTSSKSTKLIHGGLRYLKQFDFQLVKETGTERATVHKLAPHLVVPEKMLLPIVKGGTYGKWASSLGLKVYDLLAGVSKSDARKMLSAEETFEKEPLLDQSDLLGGGYYAEYRTDDARLTIEVIKRAVKLGAVAVNYLEVKDFLYKDNLVAGIKCIDHQSEKEFAIHSKSVVSATGPWVDKLRAINKSLNGKRLHLTKGVHLVVEKEKLPVQQSLYFDVPDGRMIFAIPRGNKTYFGTTDTDYKEDIDNVSCDKKDADYLINAVNETLPSVDIKVEDIESTWAGLRPLIHSEGKSASELSRKDEIFESPNGLISIAGGKLTGYRKMSERVVDLVLEKLSIENKECTTDKIDLCDKSFGDFEEVLNYKEQLATKLGDFERSAVIADKFVHLYGYDCDNIVNRYEAIKSEKSDIEEALLEAELEHCLSTEMIQTPLDFFERRSGKLFFDIQSVTKNKDFVLNKMKECLSWNTEVANRYKSELEEAIKLATKFV